MWQVISSVWHTLTVSSFSCYYYFYSYYCSLLKNFLITNNLSGLGIFTFASQGCKVFSWDPQHVASANFLFHCSQGEEDR